MNPAVRCPGCDCGCRCDDPGGAPAHALVAALLAGDLDQAIATGLLDGDRCAGCSVACTGALFAARDARLAALAARERYRARNARLQRRAAELAAKRAPARAVDASTAVTTRPALPSAAAAALARAKAKAAERHQL